MNRRKMASLSAAFVLGAAAAEYSGMPPGYILAAAGAVWMLAAGYLAGRQKGALRVSFFLFASALAAAAVCGSCVSCVHQSFYRAYEEQLEDGGTCRLLGEVYRREKDGEAYHYYLKNCRADFAGTQYPCGNVLVDLDVCDYSIGEILSIKGKIKTFSPPSNEGGYDEKAYYRSRQIGFRIVEAGVIAVSGKRDALREWLQQAKEKMAESYQDAMPEADAGVLTAMVLGDKSRMDTGRSRMYQDAGISHFYSISGLHISLIGMVLYRLMRKRGVPYLFSCGMAAVWMAAYGEMTGFGVSASRAIGMFLMLMYAEYRGRSYDRPTALALMAAVLAGMNPGVLHHAGYLLSFGAAAGVLMAEWLWSQAGQKEETGFRKIREGLKEALLVSVCIQLVTIPVLCMFFYEISVYTALINLLILPCMGVLLGFGIAGGIAGCFVPLAAKLILYPCYLILLLFDAACRAVLGLPYAVLITGRLSLPRLILWYGAIALFLAAVFAGSKIRPNILCLALPLCGLLLLRPAPRFEIDILDVGQGDGVYIATGDGTSLFLDGGSTNVKKVGTYRILPFLKCRGIRRVDCWFVSHCDADHISGLCEVMEAGYPIGCLAVSELMPEDEAWQALKGLAAQKQIPILVMGSGDAVRGNRGTWACKCISPENTGDAQDRNANSLVLLYESRECSGFFGGDIGTEQENALLLKWKLPKIDVYKASHHGSDTSNGQALLCAIQPEIAVISCGLRNSYGHPGTETIRRLKETAGRIYETRYLGQIKITGAHLEEEVSPMLK